MRIFKDKYYKIGIRHTDSWGDYRKEITEYIITGHRAQGRSRIDVISEYKFAPNKEYRILDGHLPDRCPIGNAEDAKKFLELEIYQAVQEASQVPFR